MSWNWTPLLRVSGVEAQRDLAVLPGYKYSQKRHKAAESGNSSAANFIVTDAGGFAQN
jgi:hypothetical protein